MIGYILCFGAGLIFGVILWAILTIFVIKEGKEILPNHPLHHYGDKKEDDCQ